MSPETIELWLQIAGYVFGAIALGGGGYGLRQAIKRRNGNGQSTAQESSAAQQLPVGYPAPGPVDPTGVTGPWPAQDGQVLERRHRAPSPSQRELMSPQEYQQQMLEHIVAKVEAFDDRSNGAGVARLSDIAMVHSELAGVNQRLDVMQADMRQSASLLQTHAVQIARQAAVCETRHGSGKAAS